MQNDPNHEASKCQDPDCPLHGKDGVFEKLKEAGFKIQEGQGAGSLGEALNMFMKDRQQAAQRSKIRDTITNTCDTVVRIELQKHDGSEEVKQQALIEAFASMLGKAVAIYASEVIAEKYGLTPGQMEENVDRMAGHFYEAFSTQGREMAAGVILAVGIEREARKADELHKQVRDQTEAN